MIRAELSHLLDVSPRGAYLWFRSQFANADKPEWQTIQQGVGKGIELYLPWRSPNFREMGTGQYDEFLFDAVTAVGNLQGAVIWDVGAHVGYSSLLFSRLVGDQGRVMAFEPNPANRLRMQMHIDRNVKVGQRISTFDIALSNVSSVVTFQSHCGVDSGQSFGGHLEGTETPMCSKTYRDFRNIEVMTESADNLVATGRVPPPSIIKIDVEGAELSVLQGASRLLAQEAPVVFVEIHHVHAMFNCLNFLHSVGYAAEMLEVSSVSRCFIAARPVATQYAASECRSH